MVTVKLVAGDADLLECIEVLRTPGRQARRLHGRQQHGQ